MEAIFERAGTIRRIFIKDRKVTMITPETGFAPIMIDLNKIENMKDKIQLEEYKMLINLKTEKEMLDCIASDFKKTGWRLIKNNG